MDHDTDPYDDVLPVSRDRLVKRRLPERDVDIEGVGTVRVRGLSRADVIRMGTVAGDGNTDAAEAYLLRAGLVDPVLTDGDVTSWRDAAPAGELEPVVNAILELSGLMPSALKEAVQTFRGGTGAEAGVPPGPGAGDDRDPAA